jgi:hypothetical protein
MSVLRIVLSSNTWISLIRLNNVYFVLDTMHNNIHIHNIHHGIWFYDKFIHDIENNI